MATTKTDNASLAPKLEIRRRLLTAYHRDTPPRVFDACQGSAVLWTRLRAEYPCRYWGVDVKERKGRVKVDSARVLEQPGWDFDVIDIDTYGAPWRHYSAVCRNLPGPVSVFLTIGSTMFKGALDKTSFAFLGLGPIADKMPTSFARKITPMALDHCVAMSYTYGVAVEAAWKAAAGSATYYGLRLVPTK